MSKTKNIKNDIKSKIEAIKKINDDPKGATDDIYNKYLKDLPSTDQLFGKKLDDFLEKRRKKKENKKDLFSEFIDIADSFIQSNQTPTSSLDRLIFKQKIKQHANDSASVTLDSVKEIVSTNVKKIFFAGDGICGANSKITTDSITISPKEIDFLNVLTIDPSSNVGKIVYEPQSPNINKQKVNRELYSIFSGGEYDFDTNNDKTLFTTTWDSANQNFLITGLTQLTAGVKVESFFNDYFSSIELPDITGITKTAILMTIQGDGSESQVFNKSLNNLDRLLKKLFSVCGTPTDREALKNQNALDLFDENDEDIEFYFNFDDIEGIDLDDEQMRYKKVMRFKDCDNFEVPVNTDIIEDFVYLTDKKTINDVVNDTLNRVASDAYEKSNSNIPPINFNLSVMNLFILNLPKALISSILTPKVFLPIVIVYKLFKSLTLQVIETKDLMKKLYKLFYAIIKDIFWKFLREFWKRIKKDLLIFLQKLIKKILKNKYKRYAVIITALISLLKKILENGIDNCTDLFGAILSTINSSLTSSGGFNVPGVLLGLSDYLPGFSSDRAFINAMERMNSSGVYTDTINGAPNDFTRVVKDMFDSLINEMDTNSFIKVSNKEIIIPTPLGPLVIPPGLLNSAGKLF